MAQSTAIQHLSHPVLAELLLGMCDCERARGNARIPVAGHAPAWPE